MTMYKEETKAAFYYELTAFGDNIQYIAERLRNRDSCFPDFAEIERIKQDILTEVSCLQDFLQVNKDVDNYPDYVQED